MDATAKDTRAALKAHVLPLLRAHGFDDGTPSKLWRQRGARIDYIEMKCLSAYEAQTLDATTASFVVRIAMCLPGYSALDDPFHRDYVKAGPKGPRPSEAQMPIRGVISPPDAPPMKKGRWGWEFQTIWGVQSVEDAGRLARDLAAQLDVYGLEWLQREWDLGAMHSLLKRDETSPVLVATDNGSHLRLQAEVYGSAVRSAHVAMVRSAIARARD